MVGLEAEVIDIGLCESGKRSDRRWISVRDIADCCLGLIGSRIGTTRFVFKYKLVSGKLFTRDPSEGLLALHTVHRLQGNLSIFEKTEIVSILRKMGNIHVCG